MPKPVYLHFFLGEDSYSSLKEVQKWEALFLAKHGDATRYILDGSEQDASAQLSFLTYQLGASNLFGGPTLLLLKRVCTKPAPAAAEKAHLTKVLDLVGSLSEGVTLLWWEPLGLPDEHPLTQRLNGWQQSGQAKQHTSALPEIAQINRFAQAYLSQYGQSITPDAQSWLRARYQQIHSADERSWWLHLLLEAVSLRSAETSISRETFASFDEDGSGGTPPFALTEALSQLRFADAQSLAAKIAQTAEPSSYFALFGALAWQISRKPGRLSQAQIKHAQWLLGQVELALKMGDIQGVWLLSGFIYALEHTTNLFSPRIGWLATLPV